MTNGDKITLAMMILKYLANEEMTHRIRRLLAQIAIDLLKDNDTPVSFITGNDDPHNIPF